MDYDDNESEGPNLHLAGEESSKISSVLRPFALPKFDFDDSLHGHLRFDSLVESEVFLGIPSQEDNNWIEDFSRGSSGIVFSSSAAESCALPSHINVWSEATSSESVELLLKAVGQEEMASGENTIEESCPVVQPGSSIVQMDNLTVDSNIKDVDNGNGSITPNDDVQGDPSRSNQNVDVKDDDTSGRISPTQEISFSSHELLTDSKKSDSIEIGEKLSVEIKATSIDQVETGDLTDDSLHNQVEENIPALGSDVEFTEGSSENDSVCVGESVRKDNLDDTSLAGSHDVAVHIPESDSVEDMEKEFVIQNDIEMSNITVEADKFESRSSLEVPSQMEPSEEKNMVKTVEGESAIDGTLNEVTQDVNLVDDKSASSYEGKEDSVVGLGACTNNDTQTHANIEPMPGGVTQSSVQLSDDDVVAGSNSSFLDPPSSFASSMSHDLPNNPPAADLGDKIKDEDTSGYSKDCTISECSAEPVTEQIDALIHSPHPLPAANTEMCREDCHLMEEDVCEREQGDPICEKEVSKSSLEKKEICYEKEKEMGPNITGNTSEQNVKTASECQPDEFTGTFSVLNAEEVNIKLVSSAIEDDEFMHSEPPSTAPSFDTCDNNQSKENNDSDSLKDPSSLKESLGPNEPAHAVGTDGITPFGSAESGGFQRYDDAITLVETTTVDLPEESFMEGSKNVEHTGSVQDHDADVPFSSNLTEANRESSRTISATIPVSCTGITAQLSAPDVSSPSPSKSVMNSEASLEKSITEKVGEVLTTSSTGTVSCQAEESFTFDVRPLGGQSTVDTVNDSFSLNAERTVSTSGNTTQRNPKLIKETSGGFSERKTRRGGSRSVKGSVKRGNQAKETPTKQNSRGEKSAKNLSPLGAGQLMTFDSAIKQRGSPVITTSNLPDLNSSAKSSAFFQQPFTDSQQVQLRAQIFVYGSIIQGVAPEEACMVSAFDGARHVWESAWRACIEKLRVQKSQGNNSETHVPLCSGSKGPEPTNNLGFSSGTARSSSKITASPVSNPAFSMSSPLWSIATPSVETLSTKARGPLFDHQAVSPLHPFQTPSSVRNFTANTTWPSQSPFPVPWLASSQSSPFGVSTNYSAFPITEPVRLTPGKDSSSAISSGTNLLQTTPPAMHSGATTMFSGATPLVPNKVKASSGQASLDTKSRKRKKSSSNDIAAQGSLAASQVVPPSVPPVTNYSLSRSPAPGDGSQFSVIARNNVNLPSTPVVNSHYSTSVAVTEPSTFVSRSTTEQLFSLGTTTVSHDIIKTVGQSKDRAAALNADGFKKVEDAKLHAQEAASRASEAFQHCESMWNQLKHHNDSGLTEVLESKLASAASAVAAAACVAKAASAAANVALSAAMQAKLLAEEAVTKSGTINTVAVQDVNMFSMYGTPSLEISSAREAARRRVEAASAATRHAENLDAIAKAAELASEAVSHTGKIVAMGDPFSVRELVEAGPDNYWRVLNAPDVPGSKTTIIKSNRVGIGGVGLPYLEGPEMDKVADSSRMVSLVPGHYFESGLNSDVPYAHQSLTNIEEGSLVEVLKDCGDQKEGWFSASVVSLKDSEAYVTYTEILSDEGTNQLKEWVSLESKDGEPPSIRIPHPMTSVQFEGNRKRRRSAAKDYTWSVGDRVDAWVQDCWREGVIAEKNAKDTTSLGVHFSAQGETLMVKLWHLRPTLVWTSGQWIEWCRPRKDGVSQGDTPIEKRLKLGSLDTKGKATMSKSTNNAETGQSEESRLPLSSNDKVLKFNIGGTGDDSKRTTVRTGRSVPEKGRGVVFGVPKPGKKRKFMEVSKHYVSDRSTKVNEPDDSMKLARFLAPHGSGPRGLKNLSKVDKERQIAGSKAKVPKFGKPPSVPGRTVVRKDESCSSRENEHHETIFKGSISNDETRSGEEKLAELGPSNAEETSGGDMVFSSKALPKENRKKLLTKGGRSERLDQGERFPTSGKVAKTEANEKITSQVTEPRRSNRRIQPTSRLLEGLQSSLTISKPPSSSHDKSHRSQSKGSK